MEHDLKIFDKDGKALHIASVISRFLLILVSIPIGWFTGQLIAYGFMAILQKFGLDDNLFRFLDAVTLF